MLREKNSTFRWLIMNKYSQTLKCIQTLNYNSKNKGRLNNLMIKILIVWESDLRSSGLKILALPLNKP